MTKTLLVICGWTTNWYDIFAKYKTIHYKDKEGKTIEEELKVEQASWNDIKLTSYSEKDVIVDLEPSLTPIPDSPQSKFRTIQPDFILIRNTVWGTKSHDCRNILFGFMHANIPSLNSLDSMYMCLERPIVIGKLAEIRDRVGKEKFPLIDQNYHSSYSQIGFPPPYPIVAKIGHAHAGFGKMKIESGSIFEDFRSIASISNDYTAVEPYINKDYDIRIQRIGQHYRAFKRESVGWKGNASAAIVEEIPITNEFMFWCKQVNQIFTGFELYALDAVHCVDDDKFYILELNDCSFGLLPSYAHIDEKEIRDLTITRMQEALTIHNNITQHDESLSSSFSSSSSSIFSSNITETTSNNTKEAKIPNAEEVNLYNRVLDLETQIKENEQWMNKLQVQNEHYKERWAQQQQHQRLIDRNQRIMWCIGGALITILCAFVIQNFVLQ